MLGVGGAFKWLNDAAHVVTSAATALLVLAAVAILAAGLLQGWRRARQPLVVISTLVDATGDDQVAKVAPGLAHRIREQLVTTLPAMSTRAKELVDHAQRQRNSPIGALVVAPGMTNLPDEIDKSAQELTDSVAAVAPEPVRPAVQTLTRALLRPTGVQAAGMLQRVSDAPGKVAISFTLSDLRSARQARRVTVWEAEDSEVAGQGLSERFHGLVVPAAGVLAIELLRQRLQPGPPAGGPRAGARQQADFELLTAYMTGIMYQIEARRMAPATATFYRLSAGELRRALDLNHYRVYEVLGDSLAEQARRTVTAPRAEDLLRQAVSNYGEALSRLGSAGLDPARLPVEALRITASRTLAWALLAERCGGADPTLRDRAVEGLSAFDTVDPASLRDATVLYNSACAWAVAARGDLRPDAAAQAKRYLLHTWLRDGPRQGWFREMQGDLDLEELKPWAAAAHTRLLEAHRPEDLVGMGAEEAALAVEAAAAEPRPDRPARAARPEPRPDRPDRPARKARPPA